MSSCWDAGTDPLLLLPTVLGTLEALLMCRSPGVRVACGSGYPGCTAAGAAPVGSARMGCEVEEEGNWKSYSRGVERSRVAMLLTVLSPGGAFPCGSGDPGCTRALPYCRTDGVVIWDLVVSWFCGESASLELDISSLDVTPSINVSVCLIECFQGL